MKHMLFTAAFVVAASLVYGQQATLVSVTKTTLNDCETQLNTQVTGLASYSYKIEITVSPFPNGPFPVTTVTGGLYTGMGATVPGLSYTVSPSNASMYHLTLHEYVNNSWVPRNTLQIPVNAQKCYYPDGAFSASDDYAGYYVFVPDNPNEASIPGMEVKWKLEEVDVDDWEPVFTLEDISCWTDKDQPGMTHTFDGFDALDASSITALQMGSCSSADGFFDVDKLYCITRSTRIGNDDWEHYSLFVGAGSEEEESAQRGAAVPDSETAALFTLAQDRAAKRILFNTTVDAGEMVICDIAGNKLGTITLQSGTFTYGLNVETVAKGVYIAQLQSGAEVTVKKFAVE